MRAQDLEDFGARELRRHVGAFLQPLAQLRARYLELVLGAVRARASGGHAVAAVAPERDVHLERPGLERAGRDLVEDAVRVERPVEFADAGMVASDDEVRAAVVLSEERVQQRLARPGVAHVERIARLHYSAGTEVFFYQHGDGARAHLGRDVAGLERA